ncbi:MAG: hypothetical protein RL596_419 [Bacteroidota bacterium]
MSRKEKLKKRFLSHSRDFSFQELVALLKGLGYEEDNKGRTSGSRAGFINHAKKHIISLHKPHPSSILKMYQVETIIEELLKNEVL